MMCHNLLLGHPENLSLARANMTLEEVKNEFFKKMSKVITYLKLSGRDIYNADVYGQQRL
jgi:hypothetical protein